MKPTPAILLALTAALTFTACETPSGIPNRAGTGALTGGAIGAASGALLGGRHAGPAAIIGGAMGAVAGGAIGHAMDREAQARLQQQAPQTYARLDQGRPLNLADIKALAAARVGDDVIISQIRSTRSAYQLSSHDIIDLKQAGVSDRVLEFMINTPNAALATAPVAAGPPAREVIVSVPPPPARVEHVVIAPGPGYVWVTGEWVWTGRWNWIPGRWMLPPHPHAHWVPPTWSRGPHGYHRHGGHWR